MSPPRKKTTTLRPPPRGFRRLIAAERENRHKLCERTAAGGDRRCLLRLVERCVKCAIQSYANYCIASADMCISVQIKRFGKWKAYTHTHTVRQQNMPREPANRLHIEHTHIILHRHTAHTHTHEQHRIKNNNVPGMYSTHTLARGHMLMMMMAMPARQDPGHESVREPKDTHVYTHAAAAAAANVCAANRFRSYCMWRRSRLDIARDCYQHTAYTAHINALTHARARAQRTRLRDRKTGIPS